MDYRYAILDTATGQVLSRWSENSNRWRWDAGFATQNTLDSTAHLFQTHAEADVARKQIETVFMSENCNEFEILTVQETKTITIKNLIIKKVTYKVEDV